MTFKPNVLRQVGRARMHALRWAVRFALACFAAASAVGAFLWACSSANDAPPTLGATTAPSGTAAPPLDCSRASTGCPCSQPGQTVSCGHVVYKSKDYTSCSLGTITCQDGAWSACKGDQIVTLNSWQLGVHLLNQPAPVPADNVCDPSLFQIDAVLGDGGVSDSPYTVSDSGAVTLTPVDGAISYASAYGCTDAAALLVTPSTANLVITTVAAPPTPSTQQFTATLSGCSGDAGITAVWTVDQPGVAVMNSGGQLSLAFPYVGPIHVTAYAGSLTGTATLNVTVNATDTTGVDAGTTLASEFNTMCGSTDAGGGG